MQEYRPDEDEWTKPKEFTKHRLARALKDGSEVVVFDGGNRKQRRAAEARHRRSKKRNSDKKRGC